MSQWSARDNGHVQRIGCCGIGYLARAAGEREVAETLPLNRRTAEWPIGQSRIDHSAWRHSYESQGRLRSSCQRHSYEDENQHKQRCPAHGSRWASWLAAGPNQRIKVECRISYAGSGSRRDRDYSECVHLLSQESECVQEIGNTFLDRHRHLPWPCPCLGNRAAMSHFSAGINAIRQ